MEGLPRAYEIIAIASLKWTPAYKFPEAKIHPNYTGVASEETEKEFTKLAIDDIVNRTGLYHRIFQKIYGIEEYLMYTEIDSKEKLDEYIKKTLIYFAGKYVIRYGYLPASQGILRHLVTDDEDFEKLKVSPRKSITNIAVNEPRLIYKYFYKIDIVFSTDIKADKIHKQKSKILYKYLCERGFPPEVVALHFDAVYVHEESIAFSQREDIFTFYAVDKIINVLDKFDLDESYITQKVVYDGSKIV